MDGKIKFTLIGSYSDQLFVSSIIAITGQAILIIAYFLKTIIKKKWTIFSGIGLLLLSYIILMIDFVNIAFSSFAFWAGFPFLILGIALLVMTIKIEKNQ